MKGPMGSEVGDTHLDPSGYIHPRCLYGAFHTLHVMETSGMQLKNAMADKDENGVCVAYSDMTRHGMTWHIMTQHGMT